jgi:penicillin-binding protein 1C
MRTGRQGVVIADRFGRTLYCIPTRDGGYQHRLSWDQIPDSVRKAFVRLEDKRFYSHGGIDLLAAGRSALLNLRERRIVSGASTIPMQLARLIHPHTGRSLGKAKEILRAFHLEAQLSKQQILLLYLNNLPFGYNSVGVGAAARVYFSLPLDQLSPAQILLLAVIPKAPSLYDPFGSGENRRALRNRAASLAPLMSVCSEEIDQAMDTFRRGEADFRAPHFVRYVVEGMKDLEGGELEDQEVVRILTTLDFSLYEEVNEILRSRLAAAERVRSPGLSGTGSRLRNAASLVLDNRSGEVLVWIGSQDFFDNENGGQIDGVRRKSSSGSTLKPFLYAAALERGYTPSTLLPDLALTFGAEEGYRPENFDRRSRGLVRLRTALASSLNVPAVYLLSQIGLAEFLSTCGELGIDIPEATDARVGLGAAVGNLEVSLLELTRAFTVFSNSGFLAELNVILEAQTADGRRIVIGAEEAGRGGPSKRIFQERTAWLISDILADPAARTTGFGPSSRFNTAFPAIFKSGTASEYTSLWCVGAEDGYSVGVWAGNFDGRPAFGATGSSLPAAVVVKMLELLSSQGSDRRDTPIPPLGFTIVRICSQTGYPASAECSATRNEHFLPGTVPGTMCPVHGQDRSMDELLLQIVRGEERRPKVLFPRNGMIFYREGSTAVKSQSIPGWIVSEAADPIAVLLNGHILSLDNPRQPLLPVQPGHYRLEVVGRFGGDSVTYTVR